MNKHLTAAALLAALAVSLASPASAAVIVITQSKAAAGNVTPGDPPGFPVILSQPGAYRFDSNLTVPAGRNGLHVTSPYVEIDMNGFRLWGWNAAGDTRVANNGLYSTFGISSIRDGSISGFRFDGIRLADIGSSSWVVDDMQIFGNGGGGIEADNTSSHHRFTNNSILRNAGDGIICGLSCRIVGNTLSENGLMGVWCQGQCHVESNTISGNASYGVYIVSGTVLGNTISDNSAYGITNDQASSDVGFGNNTLSTIPPAATRCTA